MPLVQTCEVDLSPFSHFTNHQITDQTITKSLYNLNGKHGDVGVSANRGLMTKCDFVAKGMAVPVDFRTPVNVVDIDILCFPHRDCYGIVVATNNPLTDARNEPENDDGFATKREKAAREEAARPQRHYNSVNLYVANRCNEFVLQRVIKVYGEITCMRVLISPVDMPSQAPFLSAKIGSWPNLVAIGCKRSACFLGQFAAFDVTNPEHWKDDVIEVAATTDALKAMTSNTNGMFNYMSVNGTYTFPKDDQEVTSVSYIPCYGAVVIGMSNGCMVLVPLDGKSCISCLTIQYQTPIRHLVVLEPEYDPAGGFYLFSAREKLQRGKPLIIFSHKISRRAVGDDGGFEYDDMNAVMIPMHDGDYWINVHGVVNKRRKKEADASNDSTGDVSLMPEGLNTTQHVHNDGMDRTLLFYSYVTMRGEMKGGLFDLNAYYSRRCSTAQVRFDEYGQDPICSQFKLILPTRPTGEPHFRAQDISHVHCHTIRRYTSAVFGSEQLHQPQAATLHLNLFTRGQYALAARVDSLQIEVLWQMVCELSKCLEQQPDTCIAWLDRTGLLLTKRERLRMEDRPANERVPGELDKILRAIVSDEFYRRYLISFIEGCQDRRLLLHTGRWMFNELREVVMRMDESIAPIFNDAVNPDSLPKDSKDLIAYCPDFFEFAEQVFWKVRARGAEMANDTTRLRWVRKMHAQMAFDLRLFLAATKWLIRKLPMHEGWAADLLAEAAELNEERAARAKEAGHPLFLEAVLGRLHEKTMDDPLWEGAVDPLQWYPPSRFNLLSLLRMGDAPVADRTALVLYFLNDLDEVVRRDKTKPEGQRRGYTFPAIPKEGLVRSFLVYDVGSLMFSPMNRQGVEAIRERWESDMNPPPKEDETVKPASKLTEEEWKQMRALQDATRVWRKLQRPDEARLRALMTKLGYGDYRFNAYLIRKGRYEEVEDLPVPGPGEEFPHKSVAYYAENKERALFRKSELPPATYSNANARPRLVIEPPPEPVQQSPVSRLVRTENITIRGKTPKKIGVFRRVTTTQVAAAAAEAAALSTPPSRAAGEVARINALMQTPAMGFRRREYAMDEDEEEAGGEEDNSNMAPDEIARIRETLRTPRSRAILAARAAAAAGAGTPDDAPRTAMIPPTSILKSAHKESRLASGVKSRLRFANEFEHKLISPRDRDNSASTSASMNQPNFDDSYEDDMEHVLSKSTPSHSCGADVLSTTRLEREIAEEEEQRDESRREEEEETDEASMESGDVHSLSASTGGEEEVTDEGDERRMEEPEEVEEAAAHGTFTVYHDSNLDVSSATDEANEAVVLEEEEEQEEVEAAAAAAAADPKTPPPTPDEEEEEEALPAAAAAAGDAAAGEVDEENVSRAVTPVDDEEEEETQPPAAVIDDEIEEEQEQELAADAAPPTPAAAAASNATFTVANASFTVATVGEEEEEEEVQPVLAAIETAAPVAAAAADPKTPPPTPEEEEDEEQAEALPAAAAAAGDAADEGEKGGEQQEEENVSRAVTPVDGDDGEEKEEEEEHAEEKEPEVVVEEEEQEEEAGVTSTAEFSAPLVRPPVPKPRTVFSSRAEPISLGLRSYIYMEDGIEKSYEEQRESSDEEGEKDNEILARLSPRRRSSSRLQSQTVGAAAAAPAASSSRKRTASRTRKDSEQEAAGPSTPQRSPRVKKERREEEEKEEGAGEAGDGHLFTTTRTRVIEEHYVEREDGVLQHTTKQSTKVVEMTDGVVMKDEHEDRETIEEEGDRAEMLDEADRVTPPMVDAAAAPATGKRTSSRPAPASRSSRAQPTPTKASTSRGAAKKDEEGEEKREDKATTPLRSPSKTTASRRKLLNDEEEEKKNEKDEKMPEEPTTPRRSTRVRKPSESATSVASAVSQTPSKSPRRGSRAAAKTPSREPSAAPSSPTHRRLVLKDDADGADAEKEDAPLAKTAAAKPTPSAPSTPGKRGRPRKEPVVEDAADAAAAAKPTPSAPSTPGKRGRPRKEPVVEDAADAASSSSQPVVALPRRRTTSTTATLSVGRKRAASETVVAVEPKKAEEEEDDGPIARLRKMRDETRAKRLEVEKQKEATKRRKTTATLPVIKEGKAEKHVVVEEKEEQREEDGDQPGTSKSASHRKRSASETAVMKSKEEDLMKTPSKKKARAGEKDDEAGAGDLSVVRRSTRKAAAAANEGLKTPAKSSKDKQ